MEMPASIISRYILREYLKIFWMVLTLLTMVSLMIHFLEKIKKFSGQDASTQPIILYFLYKLPGIFLGIMPFVILLSTLVTLGLLSRNNEIVAIRSAGVPLFTLTAPLIAFSFCLSLIFFFLNGALLPHLQKKARIVGETLLTRNASGKEPRGLLVQDNIWLLDSRDLLLSALGVDAERGFLTGVHLFHLGRNGALLSELEAQRLTHTDEGWVLSSGVERQFSDDGTPRVIPFHHKRIVLHIQPNDLWEISIRPEEMTHARLSDYIHRLSEAGLPAKRYQVAAHVKQATPFANLIMVLLGIPFALHKEKMARGMVLGLMLALSYWFLSALFISFGRTLIFPAWFAAWGTNILFLAVGCGLILRAESRG